MFNKIDGASAVVKRGGVYKTCDLYEYKGQLFVQWGGGYARLNLNGSSSVDKLNVDLLAYDGPLFANKFEQLAVRNDGGFRALSANPDGSITPLQIEGPK